MIKVVQETEFEDGSAEFKIVLSQENLKLFAEIGLRYAIMEVLKSEEISRDEYANKIVTSTKEIEDSEET